MNDLLMENTKLSAYFLWEYSGCDNALKHWYCAEDIACFLEFSNMLTKEDIQNIKKQGKYNFEYIEFVRHIAFRIYIYTNNDHAPTNWFIAENLINNDEWCQAIANMSVVFNKEKDKLNFTASIRCEKVRNYYNNGGLLRTL